MLKEKNKSAYGGNGFIKRKNNPLKFIGTEFGRLKAVVFYIPGKEIHQIKKPNTVQHLESIDSKNLSIEIKTIKKFFKKKNIQTITIKRINKLSTPPNLCFVRDLFWNGPKGVIISRMGSETRSNEEKYITQTCIEHDIKIHHFVSSPSTFEGADLLWLDSKTLLLGLNNRTNRDALNELRALFPDITIHEIKLPKEVQHLLGLMQIVANKKVLVRNQIAPIQLISLLKKNKFNIISISESNEVRFKQAMNIVTLAPNQIIMPNDCPETEEFFKMNKINIIKKFKIVELRKAAGGLACLTGILKRTS
jgi:N-dimethylarginine dimethylaminohydrolase